MSKIRQKKGLVESLFRDGMRDEPTELDARPLKAAPGRIFVAGPLSLRLLPPVLDKERKREREKVGQKEIV